MAQQTAMQEFIEWAISLKNKERQCIDWICIKSKAEELLPLEKQQIEFAYNDGADDTIEKRYKGMDEYYKKMYNHE